MQSSFAQKSSTKLHILSSLLLVVILIISGCFNDIREEPGAEGDSPYFPAVEQGQLPDLLNNVRAKNRLLSVEQDSLITYWNANITLPSGIYLVANEITLNPRTNLFESEGMIGRILTNRVELLLSEGYQFDSNAEQQFNRAGKQLVLQGNALVAAGRTIIKAPEIHLQWKTD